MSVLVGVIITGILICSHTIFVRLWLGQVVEEIDSCYLDLKKDIEELREE